MFAFFGFFGHFFHTLLVVNVILCVLGSRGFPCDVAWHPLRKSWHGTQESEKRRFASSARKSHSSLGCFSSLFYLFSVHVKSPAPFLLVVDLPAEAQAFSSASLLRRKTKQRPLSTADGRGDSALSSTVVSSGVSIVCAYSRGLPGEA